MPYQCCIAFGTLRSTFPVVLHSRIFVQNHVGGEADSLRSRCLKRLTPDVLTLQCPETSVKSFIALDKVLIELGVPVSLSARIIEPACDGKLIFLH